MTDKKESIYENPFSTFYLAEEFVRETESIIQKGLLSPEIFNISELIPLIKEPINHFVLGVPGSGKTMALAFLRVECLAYINQDESIKNEFKNIWPHIGRGLWGVYHGLLINDEFLPPQSFKGFGLDNQTWTNIFCDFINVLYLKRMLNHLDLAITEPEHYIPAWLGFSKKQELIKKAIIDFSKEINMPENCNTSEALLIWADKRLSSYQQMINERTEPTIDMSELPSSNFYRKVGYLTMKLINQLRQHKVIESDQNILFILDEYDQCVLANRPEFAQAINAFVKSTARGSVKNVSIKIGSRPQGFHDKSVSDSDALIEDGRDYKTINLMSLLRSRRRVFSGLIKDIGDRRIKNVAWFKERGIKSIKSLFQDITPLDEAETYRLYKADQDLHFKNLESYCKLFNDENIYKDIVEHIKSLVSETLYQKYLIIEACRKLQKLKKINGKNLQYEYKNIKSSLISMGKFINSGRKIRDNSKLYYKLKDLKEPALFLLANDFKQPKYYCGFETIKLMSEGVPLNFIKLCRAIFDELCYKTSEFEKNKKIDIRWQNRAIRKVASEIRKEANAYLRKGQSFLILLDELGFMFRRMQLRPTAPYPSINGFSVEKDPGWLKEKSDIKYETSFSDSPVSHLTEILRETIDWGYLIEMPHRSKTKSLKTRSKYYINSMLSPYYDLSIRHLKEPYYCKLEDITKLCSPDNTERSKTRKILLSNIIVEDDQVNKQLTLYDKQYDFI